MKASFFIFLSLLTPLGAQTTAPITAANQPLVSTPAADNPAETWIPPTDETMTPETTGPTSEETWIPPTDETEGPENPANLAGTQTPADSTEWIPPTDETEASENPANLTGTQLPADSTEWIPPQNETEGTETPANLAGTQPPADSTEWIPPTDETEGPLTTGNHPAPPDQLDSPSISGPRAQTPGMEPPASLPTTPGLSQTPVKPTRFFIKNSERGVDFVFFKLKKTGTSLPTSDALALQIEPLGSQKHRLPGQDWTQVQLAADEFLAGYFLSPGVQTSLESPVNLGFILPLEVPEGRTVLLSQDNFQKFNKTRGMALSLQKAGWTSLPQHFLDGKFTDWEGQSPQAEWKKTFTPKIASRETSEGLQVLAQVQDLPPVLGKPRSLKAVLEDGRLWLSLAQWEPIQSGKTLAYYFFADRAPETPCDFTVFIPIKGETGPIWVFRPGMPGAQRAGTYLVNGAQMEAQLSDPGLQSLIKSGWNKVTVDFSQFLKLNGNYEEYFYATFPVTEATE